MTVDFYCLDIHFVCLDTEPMELNGCQLPTSVKILAYVCAKGSSGLDIKVELYVNNTAPGIKVRNSCET